MLADGGGDLWGLMTVVGVLALGAAIAYAMIKNRKNMSPAKRELSERKTEEVYAAEQRDPANR